MSDTDEAAEAAYAAAERMIAEAKRSGAESLSFDNKLTHALTRLPPAVADLDKLREFDLNNTQIADLAPLAGLTGLTVLRLDNTQIADLAPLAGLTGLTGLWLDGVPAIDLRPLRGLGKLVEAPGVGGLTFKDCGAARIDPRIAGIAEIEDDAERARTLFAYLEGWEPPTGAEEESKEPVVPAPVPAPLETEIKSGRLTLALPANPPLPSGPVDDRARKGWEALKEFREDFGRSLNIGNYRPLSSAIGAFDRALGESYDQMNEIGVGLSGLRIAALGVDNAFIDSLPEGAGTELSTLAAAITTFANRFPEWLAYLNDPAQAVPIADAIQTALPEFEALEKALAQAEDVDAVVLAEYRDEIELVRNAPHSEIAAHGLLASTQDLLRTLAENVLIGFRMYRDDLREGAVGVGKWSVARSSHEAREFWRLAPTEVRKAVFWGIVGVAGDVIFFKGAALMTLAIRFPHQLGWIEGVLRFIAVV